MNSKIQDPFSPFKYFERNHISKNYIISFVVLAGLMMICGNIFNIYDWVQHPQFTEPQVTGDWFKANTTGFQKAVFYAFFVFDFVWAYILWLILRKYVASKVSKSSWIYKLFIVFTVIALGFDYIENSYYILCNEYPETIVNIKKVGYALGILVVLLIWLRYSLKDRFVIFKEFITSSWISLIFLIIIGFTLPKAPQLNSIIVDLYYHPVWFVIVLLLIFAPMYCIVLSHYPNYFLFSKSNRKFKDKVWKISKRVSLFGIIWYRNADNKGNNDYENYISFLRRTIGVFFYGAIFYMLAYTADANFNIDSKLNGLASVLVFGLIWWLYVLKKRKDKWYHDHKSAISKIGDNVFELMSYDTNQGNTVIAKQQTATLEGKEKLSTPINTYLIFLVLTIFSHIALLFLLLFFEHPYRYSTVVLSLLCVTLQAITYTYYRTYRTLFRYAFFNEKIKAVIKSFSVMHNENDTRSYEEKKEKIVEAFEKYEYFGQTSFFKKLAKLRIGNLSLGAMSNNIIFLQIVSYFGFFNALLLFGLNIFPTWAMKVNSIIIIISYFFLLYGMIVIILKHFIYYNLSRENFALANKAKYFFLIATSVLVLIIVNRLASANNLFELEQIPETVNKEDVNLNNYVANLPDTRYYIGCYGGGMKANAWTMTVLNALDKNNTLYDKTVCLSGASGGTIGLINYSAIKHVNKTREKREAIIRNIGTENILSMDVIHLLGRDWVLHMLVPCDLKGKDRSTSAMRTYAEHTDEEGFSEDEFNKKSYRQYWAEMYKDKDHFPILISNTTNIKGRQGMAVSISASGKAEKRLYFGADDILELPNNKTLSFYNAVSTTNRFPLISPAATIEGVGQYNDGGLYENSGLLSAFKLYEAINTIDTSTTVKKTVFINIINDKSAYVKYRMQEIMEDCHGGAINKSSEISAILNSVAATEMFPGYIKDKLHYMDSKNANISFESIYLPHKFSLEDVKAIYGQQIKDTVCVRRITEIIEENNTEIKDLMKGASKETNTIIEPAMSRVMAKPAFDFMQYMLNHSCVKPIVEKFQ
ncbi:patatin-like phospholipase family protein [Kordia algicida OT-1]|uniref:PNPLA domain-containing protein n=1 Tax=Kordia algicida OT-1 TaxID=391587 RepID=A9E7J8_9FLAO|nr:patatin-like phospholipase family protein [Kordia algicida]EDP94906.1 hypothetical protein KAOT1_08834 [Kordia algicida OT-1]